MKNEKKASQPTMYSILTRKNAFKRLFQSLIVNVSSYFALLVEGVTRHKFGERYMSYASCVSAVFVTLFFGVFWTDWQKPLEYMLGARFSKNFFGVDLGAIMLVAYCGLFLVMTWRHRKEWKREGKTIDFERFSLSYGDARPECFWIAERLPKWLTNRIPVNDRNLWRYYEPFAAMMVGIVFLIIPWTRTFGAMMFLCGLFYYLRTRIQFSWGKEILLDKIDDMLLAEMAERIFMQRLPPEETKGVKVMTPLPENVDLRRALYEDAVQGLTGEQHNSSTTVIDRNPGVTFKKGHKEDIKTEGHGLRK